MFRRYVIYIELTGAATVDLQNVEKEFGCSISEPSNWVEYGSTKGRGLTFLDKEGKELSSSVFVHQHVFNASRAEGDSEIDEIKDVVYQMLSRHYPVTPADVRIIVREYHRL